MQLPLSFETGFLILSSLFSSYFPYKDNKTCIDLVATKNPRNEDLISGVQKPQDRFIKLKFSVVFFFLKYD